MVSKVISRSTIQVRRRAIIKTLCYRLFMVTITIIVAWIITSDVSNAVSIGFFTNILKTGTYYIYERIWDRITWGVTA